jgi:hypothetical protein
VLGTCSSINNQEQERRVVLSLSVQTGNGTDDSVSETPGLPLNLCGCLPSPASKQNPYF